MSSTRIYSLAATIGLVTTACAQSQPAATPPLTRSAQSRHLPPPRRAIQGTLYVTNIISDSENQLFGYSLRTLQQTYFTDDPALKEPEGLASDPNGAIYVANTYGYNILKFVPPATKPAMKIKDTGFRPSDVAIDSKGNIWVANWCTESNCGPGNLQEYSKRGKLLHTIDCSNMRNPVYLAIDRDDDVVVDGGAFQPPDGAAEIAKGRTGCAPLPAIQIGAPGGVTFTKNGDVTVTDDLYDITYTYAKPEFSTLTNTTRLSGIASANETAFAPENDYFWVDSGSSTGVYEFSYPAGGYPINYVYGSLYFPTGIAIVPK